MCTPHRPYYPTTLLPRLLPALPDMPVHAGPHKHHPFGPPPPTNLCAAAQKTNPRPADPPGHSRLTSPPPRGPGSVPTHGPRCQKHLPSERQLLLQSAVEWICSSRTDQLLLYRSAPPAVWISSGVVSSLPPVQPPASDTVTRREAAIYRNTRLGPCGRRVHTACVTQDARHAS